MMKRHTRSVLTVLAIFVLLVMSAGGALAHLPIYRSGGSTPESAMHIEDIQTSYAIYARFDYSHRVHLYSFSGAEGENLHFQLGIPAISGLEDFAPEVLLVGPGLPSLDSEAQGILSYYSIDVPAGSGAKIWSYDGPMTEEEFEPFTQVVFWVRQEVDFPLPAEGDFLLAIAEKSIYPVPDDPADYRETKYLFAPGVEEEFGVIDFMVIPIDWARSKVFWEESPFIFLLPTMLTVVVGLVWTELYPSRRMGFEAFPHDRARKVAFDTTVGGALLMVGSGLNQIAFLLAAPQFSLQSIGALVLVLQAMAVLVGLGSWRLAFTLVRASRWTTVLGIVVLAVVALVVGAGFVLGPVLFAASAIAQICLSKR